MVAIPRAQTLPVADDQVSFQVDGVERLRYHAARRYPRPFFYPLIGPSGVSLTRMGHPTAPDHDHHRSMWFAHHDVGGVSFWQEGKESQIRQDGWLLYEDGQEEAAMAVELGWYDAHGVRLMRQQLIAVLRTRRAASPVATARRAAPSELGEVDFEVQATFTPEMPSLELGKTNFGFFAVRVSKSISAHFGGGRLTNSEGGSGESGVHEKPARWVDYSGAVTQESREGITYIDHPSNPHHPAFWHVRDDGWMSASFNQREAYELTREQPLVLRYLLHVHRGDLDSGRASAIYRDFAATRAFELIPRSAPYRYALRRKEA